MHLTVEGYLHFNYFRATHEKSPPSSQVLRHLEALEAAIELDITMNSTPGLGKTATLTGNTPGSMVKRRLDLSSPPTSPTEDRRLSLNLNLSGVRFQISIKLKIHDSK